MFFLNITWGDLWERPFIAEIWGTVSDWVMIVVTGVTAYLLWKTLMSQKEVQEMQFKLTEIELRKEAKRILPIFNTDAVLYYPDFFDDEHGVRFLFKLNENKANVVFFKFDFSPSMAEWECKSPLDYVTVNGLGEIVILYKYIGQMYLIQPENTSTFDCNGTVDITYYDEDGREYLQKNEFSKTFDSNSTLSIKQEHPVHQGMKDPLRLFRKKS